MLRRVAGARSACFRMCFESLPPVPFCAAPFCGVGGDVTRKQILLKDTDRQAGQPNSKTGQVVVCQHDTGLQYHALWLRQYDALGDGPFPKM